MAPRTKTRKDRFHARKATHGLLEAVRHRARRRRNLAELQALDACRLEDIGLSAAARARMIA